jgi:hypothetical protein
MVTYALSGNHLPTVKLVLFISYPNFFKVHNNIEITTKRNN